MFDSRKNIRDRIPRESKRSKKSEANFFKKKLKSINYFYMLFQIYLTFFNINILRLENT